ncbi:MULTISPECIES: ABC transporter ATP-binding protein [Lactobacillus]|nr:MULTISPECIES: ABC transporter ATP-binding protein [Lactobacillus]AIS08539.1 ABC transporter ATPase and permease components [Lactobacillus sp. wkB8]AWN32858.1 ABC transporter ATP-binding protein [Lactobacillus helsingborgensis]MBC6356605.1 ABC transporter ATP-binding protein [Lactobacillus helsingborgensis]MBI0109679.1 ABC transporter ATP-binding protein [Lactobacillus sp. W8093]RMC54490.1 ABC transporter ATP-binding protein [Lactobacillus sp. ESL0262]
MVYKYYSHFKFFCLNIFGLISSMQNIVTAYIVGSLINLATAKNFAAIPVFFGKNILLLILILVATLIFDYLKADAAKQVNTKLRLKVMRGMLSDEQENASNLGFLTNDFKLLETNRYDAEIGILIYSYTVVFAMAFALYLNWQLTIIFFIGSVIPTIVSTFFQKPIQNAAEAWTNANDKYVNQTKNLLSGTATFNLYDKQDNAVKQNQYKVNQLEEKLAKMNVLNTNTSAFLNAIAIMGTYLLPFAIGIALVIKGQTTLGALFAITQLSNSFVNPILQILQERNNLSTTKPIVRKIKQYIQKADNVEREQTNDPTFNELQVQDLDLMRQDKVLAQHINLDIKSGQKVAVIGPSGSGKSTMLQFLMYGKYGKSKKIILDHNEVAAGSFTKLFAYSSQSAVIFSDTLWFNLTLGANIAKEKVLEVCQGLQLGQLIKEKGFDYQLGDNADQLSGGQLSRIEVARAILANRPILLLDEINASLDKTSSKAIHQYIFDSNFTFVEVIHHYDPEELQKYDVVVDFNQYQFNDKSLS